MSRLKPILKIIILGDANVGKTCLLNRYVINRYLANYKSTIGVDFLTKDVTVNNRTVILQIWDTAGQERFHSLGNAFYRGADAIMLVYDISKRSTFDNLNIWFREFCAVIPNPETLPVAVVGNKIDLPDNLRQVSTSVVKTWLYNHPQHLLYETSAKDNLGVIQVFTALAEVGVKNMSSIDLESDFPPSPPVSVKKPVIPPSVSQCGC